MGASDGGGLTVTRLVTKFVSRVTKFVYAAKLCFLLLFAPEKYEAIDAEDRARQNEREQEQTPEHQDDDVQDRRRGGPVRRAFFKSFLIVVLSSAAGFLLGRFVMEPILDCVTAGWKAGLNHGLQILGTGMLLWGTLFVRGWEIQTLGGTSLTERVNRWMYLFLCCEGTFVLVFALSWPACPREQATTYPRSESTNFAEFSKVEAVASRNSLYHILDLKAAIRGVAED